MEDTIAAISTSLGVGAISIIRLSGVDAIKIVNNIFTGQDLSKVSSNTINYGFIKYNNQVIDEVLVSIMRAPKTYTKEDIVEINTHGGIATTNKVLELCLKSGARLAEPGEFTKRAFLNGRIDLVEAEAVGDLIDAESESSRNLAINQLTGTLSNLIKDLRSKLVKIMSNIEVNIDYPEYEDAENITINELKNKLNPLKSELENLIKEANNSKIIKDGLNIALIGRPNVGKSSLLNMFLEENKAIVTNIAGTTRDIVEGSIILQGFKINLIDTAGIRKTTDVIESIGVDKSIKALNNADLVILLLNNNEILTAEDKNLIALIKDKKHVIFINKNDLANKLDLTMLKNENIIYGNTLSLAGIKPLKDKIIELFNFEQINTKNPTYLTNARQIALITKSLNHIEDAITSLDNHVYVDMVENDIKACFDTLGEIIGVTYKDELLDEMFSHFCLGK